MGLDLSQNGYDLPHRAGSLGSTAEGVACRRYPGSVSITNDLQNLYLWENHLQELRSHKECSGERCRTWTCPLTDLSEALAKHTGHAAVQPAFSHFLYFFSDPPSSSSSAVSAAFFLAWGRTSRRSGSKAGGGLGLKSCPHYRF